MWFSEWSRPWQFRGQMREFRGRKVPFSGEKDSLAVEAVLSEPFSALNSLLTGKNTGNFPIFSSKFQQRIPLSPCIYGSFHHASPSRASHGTGNYHAGTGNYHGGTGNYHGGTGNYHGGTGNYDARIWETT